MTKHLALDANIPIRAVLGTQVVQRIRGAVTTVIFLTVEEACADANIYIARMV